MLRWINLTNKFVKTAYVLYAASSFIIVLSFPSILGYIPYPYQEFLWIGFPLYIIAIPLEKIGKFLERRKTHRLDNVITGLNLATSLSGLSVGAIFSIERNLIFGLYWVISGIISTFLLAEVLKLKKQLKQNIKPQK